MSASDVAHTGLHAPGAAPDEPPPSPPLPRPAWRTTLRDAAVSALVAAGLFAILIGLRLQDGASLTLRARPGPLAATVAAVFALRLAWLRRPRSALVLPAMPNGLPRGLGLLAMIGAAALPAVAGRVWLDLATLVLIYVILGWGLNIVVGLAGLLDLGYVAFYAVGAYTVAILTTAQGWGFWAGLPVAGALAAAAGVCLGFPVLRLRGDYLAVVTLAFGEIIRVVITNWTALTGGPNGIGGIPRPTLFGLHFSGSGPGSFAGTFGLHPSPLQRVGFLYYAVLFTALLVNATSLRVRRLPLGRAWEALREDEVACRALGIDVTKTKLTAFAMGAGIGGLAGAFFAARATFVSPESFTFVESAIVLAIVVLGGMGSQLGTAVAATVLIGGSELLRGFAAERMLVFGVALVAMMVIRPRGLVTARQPSAVLDGIASG